MLFTEQQIQTIREQALGMDKRRQLTPEVLAAIYDHRLFHLFVPDELEGRMTSLPEVRAFSGECQDRRQPGMAGYDWCRWRILRGADDPGGEPPRIRAPRSGNCRRGMPTGTARQVEGGYIVNGGWKYCGGSTYATTFTANAVIEPASTVQNRLMYRMRTRTSPIFDPLF